MRANKIQFSSFVCVFMVQYHLISSRGINVNRAERDSDRDRPMNRQKKIVFEFEG